MSMQSFIAAMLAALVTLLPAPATAQSRIVTLGSDVTEIVFALGRGTDVVATDQTSTFPAAAARLPRLGYFRSLAPEPILAQRPTLVLVSVGAGPEAVIRQIERADVRVVRIPDEPSAAGVAAKIRAVAAAIGRVTAGERLAQQVLAQLGTPPRGNTRTLLILASAPGRILAAGNGTAGNSLISLVGGRNMFAAEGYRPLSAEAAIAAAPEVILVPSHVAEIAGGLDALRRDPILAHTPAARNNRLILVDSQAALNFGPRLPTTVAAIRRRMAR